MPTRQPLRWPSFSRTRAPVISLRSFGEVFVCLVQGSPFPIRNQPRQAITSSAPLCQITHKPTRDATGAEFEDVFFVRLFLLGVATVDHMPPSHPVPCILLRHPNHSHIVPHCIHKSPFWSPSSFPPGGSMLSQLPPPTCHAAHIEFPVAHLHFYYSSFSAASAHTCPLASSSSSSSSSCVQQSHVSTDTLWLAVPVVVIGNPGPDRSGMVYCIEMPFLTQPSPFIRAWDRH